MRSVVDFPEHVTPFSGVGTNARYMDESEQQRSEDWYVEVLLTYATQIGLRRLPSRSAGAGRPPMLDLRLWWCWLSAAWRPRSVACSHTMAASACRCWFRQAANAYELLEFAFDRA